MFLTLFISLILLILTIAVVFISLRITNYKLPIYLNPLLTLSPSGYLSTGEGGGGEASSILIPSQDSQYTDHRQPGYIDDLALWLFQESLSFLA